MEYAASLAKLSGGHLVILTVVKPGIKAVGGAPLEEELVYSANGPCDYLLAIGSRAAEEIIKLSRRENCDSIVIGSRGFGALEGLLKSSVSKTVIEESELPVIVIK